MIDPALPILDFSFNWNNKLDCKAFTTISQSGRLSEGQSINITLKEQFVKKGKVIIKKRYQIKQMTESMAFIDTGYDLTKTLDVISKMFGCDKISPEANFYWYLIGPWKAEQMTLEL